MTKSSDCVLEAQEVTKYYIQHRTKSGGSGGKETIRSVDGVNLCLNRGEVLGILGETGCGKSTLGRVLVGLEPPTSGTVELEGKSVSELSKEDRKGLRRRLQMIFQNPFDTFDSRHKILRILEGTLKLHNIGANHADRVQIVSAALESAGLTPAENYLHRYPSELSGGQLQRIAIMRSMLLDPKLIVADEPVSMLDMSVRADIINMLGELAHQHDTSVIFISHDIATAGYICDTIAVMYLGQIVEIGPAQEVLCSPSHPYSQVLLSNSPSVDPRDPFKPLRLKGAPSSCAERSSGCYFAPRCPKACQACSQTPQSLVPVDQAGHAVRCFMVTGFPPAPASDPDATAPPTV